MQTALPMVNDLMNGTWSLIEPLYQELESHRLTVENVAEWLSNWSQLSRLVSQVGSQLYIHTTTNTADEEAEKRYHNYLETIDPQVQIANQRLTQKLLDSGLEPAGFELQVRNMRTKAEIFREANLPLFIAEEKLEADYNKISGAQTVQWNGQEFTLSRLAPVYEDPDREKRERAWRLIAERRLADRDRLNGLWSQFMDIRQQMAANVELDYRTFRWKQFLRFDYTPDDCKQFAQAIEEVIVPATRRLYDKRRQQLGLASLRPWDMNVDPLNRPPLHPFQTVDELEAKVAAIFAKMDPQLGAYFESMRREKLLDLENRKNKAPGGYCIWSEMETPFIFMNSVGTHNDIMTLVHESGHSFHNFETRHLPYYHQLRPGREFTEVASTAMELLTAPYFAQEGSFYTPEEAARAQVKYLESALIFWPYMARVDLFQHWLYENPHDGNDPAKCDEHWAALVDQFNPGVDWSGLEVYKMTGWQHTPRHVFLYPFYYVEYGLSSLGAFQIWRNSLRNPAEAIVSYRKALSYGGTLPLRQLYETAGAKFAFDADTLREVVNVIEQTIAELETSL